MNSIYKKKIRARLGISYLRPGPLLAIVITLLLVMVFSTFCALAEEEQPPESNNYQGLRFETTHLDFSRIESSFPRLVCLGDSVTFGWNIAYEKSFPYLLEKKLKEQYPEVMVVDSGIGGQTVVDGLDRLDSDVFYFNPQVVIIDFGLNDGFFINEDNDTDLKNNIDLDIFTGTYIQLIERISEKGVEILIMSSNPVMTDSFWRSKDIANKQEESYKLYNQAARNIAKDHDLIFIDIWAGFIARGELDTLIQPDGVHPSEAGLTLISEILYKTLESLDLTNKEEWASP